MIINPAWSQTTNDDISLTNQASVAFKEGQQAFNNKQYQTAITAFLHAQTLGMDKASLYYNLGGCYFKLEDYDKARQAFQTAASKGQLDDLINYNLALIAIEQEQPEQAKALLRKTLSQTKNTALHSQATALLASLNSEQPAAGTRHAASTLHWLALLSAQSGHNSNVGSQATEQLLTQSQRDDLWFNLFSYGSVTKQGRFNPQLAISHYGLRYQNLNGYDFDYLQLSTSITKKTNRQRYKLSAHISNSQLADQPLTRSGSIEANVTVTPAKHYTFDTGYYLKTIQADSAKYKYLGGTQQRLRFRLNWSQPPHQIHSHYDYEDNNRQDATTNNSFSSYSPQRHNIVFKYQYRLKPQLTLKLSGQYRDSRYRDQHIFSDGSRLRREEQRIKIIPAVERKIGENGYITIEYAYTDNASTLSQYRYQQHIISLKYQLTLQSQ